MPAIFRKLEGQWECEEVTDTTDVFRIAPAHSHVPADAGGDVGPGAFLVRAGAAGPWAVLIHRTTKLMHNGERLTAGLRVLEHKDSLAFDDDEPVYFSTERAARIERYAGTAPLSCARCCDVIRPGQPAVRCPGCGVFHHEIPPERNCWTYADRCTACPQPTALDAELKWTPETL